MPRIARDLRDDVATAINDIEPLLERIRRATRELEKEHQFELNAGSRAHQLLDIIHGLDAVLDDIDAQITERGV